VQKKLRTERYIGLSVGYMSYCIQYKYLAAIMILYIVTKTAKE